MTLPYGMDYVRGTRAPRGHEANFRVAGGDHDIAYERTGGTTDQRGTPRQGRTYYDATLSLPLVADGATWRNMRDGTEV